MATELEDKQANSEGDHSPDRAQAHYDREFNVLTDPDHYSQNGSEPESADSLRQAEQSGGLYKSDAQTSGSDSAAGSLTGDGFFKGGAKKNGGILGKLKSAGKKRLIVGLVGVSSIGLIFGLLTIGSGLFKLDDLLNNIDTKTFSRFNASVSGRSDKWLKSYIQLRLLEKDGTLDPINGNLYFRANKVDTNNPINDWYRTLRTSKFEQDVFNKNGIYFTSMVDSNGKFRTAKITFGGDDSVSLDPYKVGISESDINFLADGGASDPARFQRIINQLGDKADAFVQIQVFDSNKESRKELKNVVNDNTHFYQVLKRRALRKDIANMTGIGSWKFFEKTQTKITNAKADIQGKILQKVFSGSSENQKFILCLFGAGPCPSTSDPNDPSNHATGTLDGAQNTEDDSYDSGMVDKDGNPITGSIDSSALSDGASEAVSETASDAAKSGDSVTQDLVKKILQKTIGQEAVPGPSQVWPLLKKLAAVDNLFENGTNGSKLTKLVKNARLSQLVAIWTTYGIARDQLHTGDVTASQVSALMSTTDNFDDSEGWSMLSSANSGSSSTVSADPTSADNPTKAEYCNPNHVKLFTEFAWSCDDNKPNGGSNAQALSAAYSSSIGVIIHPIAGVVNTVQNSFGKFFDIFGDVVGKITSPAIKIVLKATGLGNGISDVLGYVTEKLLGYVGAGPIFDGSQPGVANLLIGGSSGAAESETRAAGGVKSTPQTLNYSNQLAANYTNEQQAQESLVTRYASLSNPESLFSVSLLKLSDMSLSSVPTRIFGSIRNLPTTLSDLFDAQTHAGTTQNSAALAQFAGVDTYDIPQACQDLDPLDPNYLQKATNLSQFPETASIPVTWDLIDNSDAFWAAVYAKVGDDDSGEQKADQIYNCGSLDQQVRGGLGDIYGYTQDGGYGSN